MASKNTTTTKAVAPLTPSLPGLPAHLLDRLVPLSESGLDHDKLYTMDETSARAVYITGYELQDGDNGPWHIWTAYVDGLGDGEPIRIAGGGTKVMPMVEKFFTNNPDAILGVAYVKVETRSGRPFWRVIDPREVFAYQQPLITELDSDNVPF